MFEMYAAKVKSNFISHNPIYIYEVAIRDFRHYRAGMILGWNRPTQTLTRIVRHVLNWAQLCWHPVQQLICG